MKSEEYLKSGHREKTRKSTTFIPHPSAFILSNPDFLAHEGIATFIDGKHAIAHNKVIVIDGHVLITGSFNFSKSAEEHNAENLLVIDDGDLAAKYTANWKKPSGAFHGLCRAITGERLRRELWI